MSDERPDEFFSWRSRLSPPDALPEQGLDNRDLAWEKLAHRLGKDPVPDPISPTSRNDARGLHTYHQHTYRQRTQRRLLAYGIVAACLLLLLTPAARLFHNPPPSPAPPHQSGAVAARPPAEQPTDPPAAGLSTHISQPTTTAAGSSTYIPQPVNPPTAGSSTHISQPTEISDPVLRSGPNPKEPAGLQPMNNKILPAQTPGKIHSLQTRTAKPPDTLSSPASTNYVPDPPALISGLTRPPASQNILKNKQLRIVHINELDNPSNPAPAMTSTLRPEPDIRVLILLKNH
ncbi:MAG TPA: hypothetical protein VL727_06990 [Puia sp.]|nr:hypothetical protein [Puia sp.]